nr:MurR/RpiR family transcriptional regulator [Enterococcus ureilyticus]
MNLRVIQVNIDSLAEKYQLNKTESQILTYMNDHRVELKNLGIREIAKKSFVSTATIINMAKKMNFTGYSELVFYISEFNLNQERLEKHDVVAAYGEPFLGLLKKYQEKNIMILGSGFSQNLANYFAEYLNLYGFRATSNSHLEFLRKSHKDDVLLIFISNSGNTGRMFELAEIAQTNELESICFVGSDQSAISKTSTLSISTNTYSPSSHQDYYPQLFFGTVLIQFELLMSYTLQNLR